MSNGRVLLAEDNPALQNVLRYNLFTAGFEVVAVYRGDDALQKMRTEHFDFAILDQQMPGVEGLDVIRAIRSGTQNKDCPIILCTARVMELETAKLKEELNILTILGKPFSPREIVETVLKVVRNNRIPAIV